MNLFHHPLRSIAAWAVATSLLSACGGGSDSAPIAAKAGTQRRALAAGTAASDTTPIDATALFDWAERTYPQLFPAGAQNQSLVYGGDTYTVRYYPGTQNYLGVTGEDIFGLGSFTGNKLQGFGKLQDWRCQVLGQTCLSGIAANGAAMAGATVEAKCTGATAVVSGLTTTGSDGRYSLAISNASLPCLLRATGTNGQALYSVAAGSADSKGNGSTSTAHITTMTDLALAYLKGVPTATTFGGYAIADAATLSTAAVQAAGSAVAGTIKTAGVDFTSVGDLFGGALEPGSNGNVYGSALAQVAGKLSISLTQTALADAIVRTRSDQKSAGTPSLPAELLLRPAAPNCVALRSGSYRAVFSDVDHKTERLTLDAPTLKLSNSAGESTVLTVDGKCHYKLADGREFSVSDAGVVIARAQTKGFHAMVMFPEQTHALSTLAGRWNSLSLEATKDEGAIHTSSTTVASDGKVSALIYCGKDAGKLQSDCLFASDAASGLPNMSYRVNADGGFDLSNTTDNWTERMFLYRSGSGELMMASGGHLSLGTLDRPAGNPAVGRVSDYWNISISTDGAVASAFTEGRNTVTAVDVTLGTYRRDNVINIATGATRPERLEINRFSNGFVHRLPEAVTASDGSAQNVPEFVSLALRGAGLTPVGLLGSTQSLSLSLAKSTSP